MTTQIETMNDILRILREDPEARQQLRALLLTEEILELPAKVARLTDLVEQLTGQVQELTAAQKATDERLTRFIAYQEGVNARQETFNQEMREFKDRQEAVNARQETAIQELRESSARQETAIQELLEFKDRQEVFNREQREVNARHGADIKQLLEFKANQEVFNQEQREFNARTDHRLDNLETKVDYLLGDNFEARMERAIMPRLARHYGLHSTVLLQSQFTLPNSHFEQRLNAAVTAAKITRAQADTLRQADFIVRARRESDQAEVFCVVEVSWTVDQHDIARVRIWADILAAAGADRVYPLVVGREIPEPRQSEAAAAQVELLSVPRR